METKDSLVRLCLLGEMLFVQPEQQSEISDGVNSGSSASATVLNDKIVVVFFMIIQRTKRKCLLCQSPLL